VGAPDTEHRVELDFDITFRNGGGLQGQGFRLDIPGDDISDGDAGALLVRELGLLRVDEVRISARRILAEPHRRRHVVPAEATESDRLVELSQVVRDGLVTYPGLPAPVISDHLTREASRAVYAPGTEFHIARIDMVANTGTYVDAPSHRWADGADLAGLRLEQVADLPGVVVDVRGSAERAIGPEAFLPYALDGRAVLVLTGWSRHFGTPAYGTGHPFLTEATARHLVEAGATLVGIDSLNIDDTTDARRPVHTALLAAGIPVCEHLANLDHLPTIGFRFSAAPVAVEGMGTFPVRAWAAVPDGGPGDRSTAEAPGL
jgi:kynurenine formamidase